MIKKLLFVLTFLLCLNAKSQNLVWSTDVDASIQLSNKKNKPLLLLFANKNTNNTLLYSQILNTLDFAIWARDNVVLVKVDLTDEEGNELLERNQNLKKAFAVDLIPSICLATARIRNDKTNYQLIGKATYQTGDVSRWISNLNAMISGESQ